MKHRHGIALAALTAPLLLAFSGPSERVAFSVAEGTTVSKTFTTTNQMSMDDMTQVVNGEEMDMSMLGGVEMSMDLSQTITVVDTYEKVEGNRPTRLKRTYETLTSSMQMDSPMMASMGGGDGMEGTSDLEGVSVVFQWNEDESDYDVSLADDEEADADLLDDLAADMDLRELLPKGDVAEGETWEIPTDRLLHIMAPGGNLKILPEDEMAAMQMPGAGSNPYDMLGDFEGTFTGKYLGTREVDGTRVGVIELDVDASSTKDMTDMLSEMMEGMDMEGMPEISYDSVDMEMEFTGSGELLWDLAAGHIHSLEISGDSLMAMDMAYSMSMGGQEMSMETSIEMSGTQSLSVRVGAAE